MFKNDTCPFTDSPCHIYQPNPSKMEFAYETGMTGKILISDVALMAAGNLGNREKQIVAGLARNADIKGNGPFKIMAQLFSNLNDQPIPYSFEDRAMHFLQYLYDKGGKEYLAHNFSSMKDSPITYCSKEEFERIIKYLKSEGWINYDSFTPTIQSNFYQELIITKEGMAQVVKGIHSMPLNELVNNKIKTGDTSTDEKIEYAKVLFFDINSTMDHKRSACETLSFILERYRKDLDGIFQGDTETFFNIVNNFTIRHNNNKTKFIEHEEQLEWIFYGLLNTIITYSKMKKKLL